MTLVPSRDLYHDVVVDALEADGWTITDDPLHLSFGGKDAYEKAVRELEAEIYRAA